jgi:hypothetical protein
MPAAPHTVSVAYQQIPQGTGLDFHTVTPCRLHDTRLSSPLISQGIRFFQIAGACGIPSSAVAVSLNLTVTQPTGGGHLLLWPADLTEPVVSMINFSPGRTRANNTILLLATDGLGDLAAKAFVTGGGSVHLLIDVNGYFE